VTATTPAIDARAERPARVPAGEPAAPADPSADAPVAQARDQPRGSIRGALAVIVISGRIGVILAISGLAAPIVFRTFDADAAGRCLRRLFPRYFAAALVAANGACFAWAPWLVPRINVARDRADPAFRRLHGWSVAANGAALLLALAAVVLLGFAAVIR